MAAESSTSLVGKAGQVAVVNAAGDGLEVTATLDSAVISGAIPAGGSSLQVLRKVAADDYNVEWATLAGGGDLLSANNLSDVASAATSRTNLGIDTTANQTDSADKRFMSDAQETKLDAVVLPTGTPDGTKYLRDDNSWQAVSGGSGLTQPQTMRLITFRL